MAKTTQGNNNFQKRIFWQTASGSLPAGLNCLPYPGECDIESCPTCKTAVMETRLANCTCFQQMECLTTGRPSKQGGHCSLDNAWQINWKFLKSNHFILMESWLKRDFSSCCRHCKWKQNLPWLSCFWSTGNCNGQQKLILVCNFAVLPGKQRTFVYFFCFLNTAKCLQVRCWAQCKPPTERGREREKIVWKCNQKERFSFSWKSDFCVWVLLSNASRDIHATKRTRP